MPDDNYFVANDFAVNSVKLVRSGTGSGVNDVVAEIVDAWLDTEVAAWLVPDLRDRARVLRDAIKIHVDHALRHGEVEVLGDHRSVAVWFALAAAPAPAPDDYAARLATACGAYTERFRVLDELLADHQPHAFPQHHLMFMATRPELQGCGYGSTLLGHRLRLLDERGVAAFATAAAGVCRRFLERHGFEALGVPFRLPDGGPAVWPMWREPWLITNWGDAEASGSTAELPETSG